MMMKRFYIFLFVLFSACCTHLVGQNQNCNIPVKLSGSTVIPVNRHESFEVSSYFNLGGQVFANSTPIDIGSAFLVQLEDEQYSPAGHMVFDTLGYFYFINNPEGTYFVQVQADATSIFHEQYAPTYYGGALKWNESSPIVLNSSIYTADIQLIEIPGAQTGQGSISGTVFMGAKEFPLPGVEILLYDNYSNALTYKRTDSHGEFSFHNLAFGTYLIYPELCGLTTYPITTTLSAANPFANNIVFTVDENSVSGGLRDNTDSEFDFKENIFPNPASEVANISFLSPIPIDLEIAVTDETGRVIEVENYTNVTSRILEWDISGYSKGIYYVHFIGNDFKTVHKLIKI